MDAAAQQLDLILRMQCEGSRVVSGCPNQAKYGKQTGSCLVSFKKVITLQNVENPSTLKSRLSPLTLAGIGHVWPWKPFSSVNTFSMMSDENQ